MNSQFASFFERWTAGKRSAALYAYGAAAAPASVLYRLALTTRPHFRRRFPALTNSRLVVVSSPLVGGVGKTPLTAMLTKALSESGQRSAIVTMGYGRQSKGPAKIEDFVSGVPAVGVGDEAAELFLTTRCPVHVGDEPVRVIDALDGQNTSDWIVFDDGVSRAWEGEKRVVVVSDTDLDTPVRYLPFGRWRTTPDFVQAASYVAITSSSVRVAPDSQIERLKDWGYKGPVGVFEYRLSGIESYPEPIPAALPAGRPLVFCGISRPERFRESARAYGIDVAAFESLPDHHRYTKETLSRLDRLRKQRGCDWFLTTLKDAVKIDPAWINSTPLNFLRIAVHQVAGPDILTVLTKDG